MKEDLCTCRHGTEVRDVERATDAQELPETRTVDEKQGQGGGEVEESRAAAAVEVLEPIAVLWLDGEGQGDGGMGG